jgi:hypothetical protein
MKENRLEMVWVYKVRRNKSSKNGYGDRLREKRKRKTKKDGWIRLRMMRAVGVCVGDVESRDERRLRTRVADPK